MIDKEIQTLENENRIYFINNDGNISKDSYYQVNPYWEGFAIVQKEKDGPIEQRDMLGNVTKEQTELGKSYFADWLSKRTVEELYRREEIIKLLCLDM